MKTLHIILIASAVLIVAAALVFSKFYSDRAQTANSIANPEPKRGRLLKYFVSNEDPAKYCNGADMDSEGYRKTITDQRVLWVTDTTDNPVRQVIGVLRAAAGEHCAQLLQNIEPNIAVAGGTVIMPEVEGWAGVSIALCSCKPLFEVNALMVPGVSKVVWK